MKAAPTHYCDSADFRLTAELVSLAPTEARAFLSFKQAAERADGVIPAKYRELISIAVALTTQCAYCLDVHTKKAKQHEATREELAEAAFIAAAMRAGAALGHGLMALRLFDRALEPGVASSQPADD
jgi:AhpD family alkylhydroperoxidase